MRVFRNDTKFPIWAYKEPATFPANMASVPSRGDTIEQKYRDKG